MPATRDWFSAGALGWTEPLDVDVPAPSGAMALLLAKRAKAAAVSGADLIPVEAKDPEIQVLLDGDRVAWTNAFREATLCATRFELSKEKTADSLAFILSRLPDAVHTVDTKDEFRKMVIVLALLEPCRHSNLKVAHIRLWSSHNDKLRSKLLTAFHDCSEREQGVFWSFFLESQSPQDVSSRYGLPTYAVLQVARKVRKALSGKLESEPESRWLSLGR